jgi:predicted dienelactone hydrolase
MMRLFLMSLALALGPGSAVSAAPALVEGKWTNQASGRVVPFRARVPEGEGKRPTVIVSHGLGGSLDAMEYLGEHWARQGYLVVHLQHPGSDSSIWMGMVLNREETVKAATSVEEFTARVRDVRLALERLRTEPALAARHDGGEVAIAGHSYGARTSMALSGERFPAAPNADLADPRIRAAIVLSPPPYSGRERFSAIGIPQFHWTGTKDVTPIEESQDPALRLAPFRESSNPSSYLVVLDGADHMAFSGRLPMSPSRRGNYQRWHAQMAEATTRFLDATLRADRKAKAWLDGEGLRKLLGKTDVVERRP